MKTLATASRADQTRAPSLRTIVSPPVSRSVALCDHALRAWLFMSLGKAAVFKHIPVYQPRHVGAVGGLMGMIGGLGGN